MLRLINALIPGRVHRWALRAVFKLRHRWRKFVKLPLAGVAVICRDPEGQLLFVRHSYGQRKWAFPGGGCGRHEDPAVAARREMQEELRLPLVTLEKLAEVEETISGSPHTAHVFIADIDSEPKPDQREIIAAEFFALTALPDEITPISRRWLEMYLQQR